MDTKTIVLRKTKYKYTSIKSWIVDKNVFGVFWVFFYRLQTTESKYSRENSKVERIEEGRCSTGQPLALHHVSLSVRHNSDAVGHFYTLLKWTMMTILVTLSPAPIPGWLSGTGISPPGRRWHSAGSGCRQSPERTGRPAPGRGYRPPRRWSDWRSGQAGTRSETRCLQVKNYFQIIFWGRSNYVGYKVIKEHPT